MSIAGPADTDTMTAVETVSLEHGSADEALSLALMLRAFGKLESLTHDEYGWNVLGRMPYGLWRVPDHVLNSASQLSLF